MYQKPRRFKVLGFKKFGFLFFLILFFSLYSCTKLKLTTKSDASTTTSSAKNNTDKTESFPSSVWLIKDIKFSKTAQESTVSDYDKAITPYEVVVDDLKPDDLVYLYTNFSVQQSKLYKSYVKVSLNDESKSKTLSSKKLSTGLEMKYTSVNLVAFDTISKSSSKKTYSVSLSVLAEQPSWNNEWLAPSDSPKLAGASFELKEDSSTIGGLYVVVYRKYNIQDLFLQEEDPPYYLSKLYLSSKIEAKNFDCEFNLIDLKNLDVRKDDMVIVQGHLTSLASDGDGFNEYKVQISSLPGTDGASIAVPRKVKNFSGLLDNTKFFYIYRSTRSEDDSENEDELSLKLVSSSNKCEFSISQDGSSFEVLLLRPVSKDNIKADGGFYYLSNFDSIDLFKTLPTPIKLTDSQTLKIISYPVENITKKDIFDIKLDSAFSLDYALDDGHQYNFLYMFKFFGSQLSSHQSKAVFYPINTSSIFNVKQDNSLYFTTQFLDSTTKDKLNLYVMINNEKGKRTDLGDSLEYLNLENFKIYFKYFKFYPLDADPLSSALDQTDNNLESKTDSKEEEEGKENE